MILPEQVMRSIEESEVHVWKLADPEHFDLGEEILSAEERARARAFRFPKDRRRFVTCHTLLRMLLGTYCSQEPKSIEFLYSRQGKPREAGDNTHFNMSHCDGMALFAFCRIGEVGIDVERVRPLPDMHDILRRYGSVEDLHVLQSLPATQADEAFFRWWTVREAHAKCTGEGLEALERPIELNGAVMSRIEQMALFIGGNPYRIVISNPDKEFVSALCSSSDHREIRRMDATPLLVEEMSCCL